MHANRQYAATQQSGQRSTAGLRLPGYMVADEVFFLDHGRLLLLAGMIAQKRVSAALPKHTDLLETLPGALDVLRQEPTYAVHGLQCQWAWRDQAC
jgi:hypothetical protein